MWHDFLFALPKGKQVRCEFALDVANQIGSRQCQGTMSHCLEALFTQDAKRLAKGAHSDIVLNESV